MNARPFIGMLQLIIFFGAIALGSGTVSAQDYPLQRNARNRQVQMQFRGMDQDGDGVITRGEWRGNTQSFRRHDINRDGVLSGEEIWEPRGNETNQDQAFDQLDRNDDRAISRSEWRQDRWRLSIVSIETTTASSCAVNMSTPPASIATAAGTTGRPSLISTGTATASSLPASGNGQPRTFARWTRTAMES